MQPKNIIIVLTIIIGGLILGVVAGSLLTAPKEAARKDAKMPTAPAPAPRVQPAIELPQIGLPESFPQPPAADAADEEKSDFGLLIFSVAKEVDTIDIYKNCDLSPAIVRISEGSSVKFSNKDSVPHAIRIFEELVIPAGKEDFLVAEFKFGPGVYGIHCDSIAENVAAKGYLQVVGETEVQ